MGENSQEGADLPEAQPDPPPDPAPEPTPPTTQTGDDPIPRLPSTVMPASRPRFMRGFCLGALSIVVIVILAIGGFFLYMYDRVLEDAPMPVRVVGYSKQDAQKIRAKFHAYGSAVYRGRNREIQFSEREFNIFTREEIRERGYKMGDDNFYVRFIEDKVVVYLSMFLPEKKKWVNVIARGKLSMNNGNLALQLEYAKVGKQEMPDSSLPSISDQIKEHLYNTPAYQEGLALVRTARIQNGKLHLRLDKNNFKEYYNRMNDAGEL